MKLPVSCSGIGTHFVTTNFKALSHRLHFRTFGKDLPCIATSTAYKLINLLRTISPISMHLLAPANLNMFVSNIIASADPNMLA